MSSSLITRLSVVDRHSKKDRSPARSQDGRIFPDPFAGPLGVDKFRNGIALSSLLLERNGGNRLFVLYGHSAVHSLALRLLTGLLFHGQDVVVLDAGNLFDPYLISRRAQALGREPKEFLSRILVSRSFTCHQTYALARKVYVGCRENASRIILVLGCLTTFYDEDVPLGERAALLKRTLGLLKEMARRGTRILLTSSEPSLNVPGRWIDLLVRAADGAARLGPHRDGSLGLHPVKGMGEESVPGGLDRG